MRIGGSVFPAHRWKTISVNCGVCFARSARGCSVPGIVFATDLLIRSNDTKMTSVVSRWPLGAAVHSAADQGQGAERVAAAHRDHIASRIEQGRTQTVRRHSARGVGGIQRSWVAIKGGSTTDPHARLVDSVEAIGMSPRLVDKTWKKSSAKLDLLMELVEELREGEHRALVFSQFVKHLTVIRESLDEQGIEYQYLDGATPAKERQRRVDAFQDGEGELFLISLKAGGTGLNLTGADYVIHLDPWWNPAVEDQATDRAHRIGQERPVTVYRWSPKARSRNRSCNCTPTSVELVAGVLDGTDRAARMDTEDLIKLIKEGASG